MLAGRDWRKWATTLRRALAWAAIALGPSATGAAAASPPIAIENIRVGYLDRYRPGSWTPLWVDLKAGPGKFAGVLEVVVADDDGTPTAFRREFGASGNEMVAVPSFARPGRHDNTFTVNVIDAESGRMVASKAYSNGEALQRGQALVLTMGRVSGVDTIPGAMTADTEKGNANFNIVPNNAGAQVAVMPVRVPGGVPGKWYGYDAAGVVVLNANSDEAMEALDAGKGEALKEWVRNGGHLVVAIGEKWQAVLDSTLRPLLPALPVGRERLLDPGRLETFAGSHSRPIVAAGRKGMTVTKLEPVEALGGRDLGESGLVVVRGHYGFGRVTVVGLDVDQKPFSDWPDRKDFWAKVLDLRIRAGEENANNPGMPGGGGFYQAGGTDIAGALHRDMERFPGVRLVPFGYVAFFVFLYILLIGPGDYFFLKRVVKRMEMTWVTFPLIVATVSALAYGAAFAVKGTELKINKVDAVDIDQTTGLLRGTTWFTIFSPQNRDYDLSIAPLPPDRDPASDAVAPSPAAGAGDESILSWFGAPEGAFGGGGGGGPGGLSLSAGSYAYSPIGEARTLQGVRVPIWTTKSFAGRWFGAAGPAIDADLQNAGPGRLTGTVTNHLPRTLRRALLLSGSQYYDLGELKPGQSKPLGEIDPLNVEGRVQRILGQLPGINAYQQYTPNGQPVATVAAGSTRADVVFAAMFRDAAGSSGPQADNLAMHDLDLSGQLALDRPMLFAEVDGPAATLGLGKAAGTPKVDQTTVLRVILPPAK